MQGIREAVAAVKSDLSSERRENSQTWPGANGKREAYRVVAKLLALYPRVTDPKLTLEAYAQELGDVPGIFLRAAARAISEDAEVNWLPTVAEIKSRAARIYRDARVRSGDALPWSPHVGAHRLNVGRELAEMRRGPTPRLLQALGLPAGEERRQLGGGG